MKKLLIIFVISLIISPKVYADKVQAEGYGYDSAAALISAKRNAIARVSGEFIDSKEVLEYNQVSSELKTVVYGVVKDYEVVSNYDPKTRKMVITADVSKNNSFFTDPRRSEKLKLRKGLVAEAGNAQNERMTAIKDLYKNLNDIYDVKVEKVDIGQKIDENNFYIITLKIETKDSWLAKRAKLEEVVGNFDILSIGSRYCQIPAYSLRFIDEKNELRVTASQIKNEKSNGILLGAKDIYKATFTIKTKRDVETFDFKMILFKDKNYDSYGCLVATPE